MVDSLRIVQVSDIHIGHTDEPISGVDVRRQFLEVLHCIRQEPLDLLVISGDLAAFSGEIEAYQWIKQVLQDFSSPYLVIAGNHDHAGRLAETFNLQEFVTEEMLFFTQTVKNKRIFFLDTSSYVLPPRQIAWLQEQLATQTEPCLLFMHHPPLLCNCTFMDTYYPLRNHDEVWAVIREYPMIEAIFCGHYHADRTMLKDNKTVYVTPSTALQIDTETLCFEIKDQRAGWRVIDWSAQGVKTEVRYLVT
jgi:Icc protein